MNKINLIVTLYTKTKNKYIFLPFHMYSFWITKYLFQVLTAPEEGSIIIRDQYAHEPCISKLLISSQTPTVATNKCCENIKRSSYWVSKQGRLT